MPTPAAEQAQAGASDAVHAAATQASAVLNKLSGALQKAGVDTETVKQVDDMANAVNSIASAAVDNAPPEPAAPEAPPAPLARDPLEAEVQGFHQEAIAAGGAGP